MRFVMSVTPGKAEDRSDAFLDEYAERAKSLIGGILRGRSGFGALRHFDRIFRDTARLVLQSSFISLSSDRVSIPLVPWHRRFRDYFLDDVFLNHRFFVSEMLTKPINYDPRTIWALFWALAKAEHEFLRRYIPFWSHEERIRGHLVFRCINRLEGFADAWLVLSGASSGEVLCRIWYADTAMDRRERETGADFGLVIHAKYPGQDELFKVVRFQAKKASRSGHAFLSLRQLKVLSRTENLGYYVFYHPFDEQRWSLTPTVASSSGLKDMFKDELVNVPDDEDHTKLSDKSIGIEARDGGWDFSSFVTFAVADPASEHGVLARDPKDAALILMSHSMPSRVMIMTVGQGASTVDWGDVLREYLPQAD